MLTHMKPTPGQAPLFQVKSQTSPSLRFPLCLLPYLLLLPSPIALLFLILICLLWSCYIISGLKCKLRKWRLRAEGNQGEYQDSCPAALVLEEGTRRPRERVDVCIYVYE